MATKLRTQEVAALRRALDSERYATKLAQEKIADLQKALEGERSALRVFRRDATAQIKAVREEENNKYTALIEQLKTSMALGQSEAVEMQRESTARSLAAEFQREMHAREQELKKEARKQIALLEEQLKEAMKQEPAQSEKMKNALIQSLHAEYRRTAHAEQEEWKRKTKLVVENVTEQLREAQRQCQELSAKLAATANEAEQAHKLQQEVQTLKVHNKELEDKVQVLTESDRRKVEEFRSQYEEFEARTNEMQKAARKETYQLLDEMKNKDRHIVELERELHLLTARLNLHKEYQTSSRMLLDTERPGEPPRLCMRRSRNQLFASDSAKRVRGGEAHPRPSDRNPATKDILTTEPTHDTNLKIEKENTNKTTESSTIPVVNKCQIKTCPTEVTTTDDLVNNSWTKFVGLDTLYKLLCEEHQELQKTYQAVCVKLKEEERIRLKLEEQCRDWKRSENENAINLAMADQIRTLLEHQSELESEARELREQNDLLEFRILELDDSMCNNGSFSAKSSSSRSPDTRDVTELDDVSDSGVMSLTTSEDISEADFQDFKTEPNNRDVKSRLAHMCQNADNVNDQICLQQTLTLLRHYESRLEGLETTLAAMCQEAAMSRSNSILSDTSAPLSTDTSKSPSRIIATVLPFTDLPTNYENESHEEYPVKKLLRDIDCLQESGIFEGSSESITQGTQTDCTVDKFSTPPGDLSTEIRKLTQIRERIEEQGGNKKLLKIPGASYEEVNAQATLKDLLYYRERLELLENKVAIYESRGDVQSKLLAARLEREVLLAAQVEFLNSTVEKLHEENRHLEEEKCEFEEAENDTRLRCQKLEVKLSALGEKKSDLQVQLQQNARTMSNLRSSLTEEEKKRLEGKHRLAILENTVNRLEQQNFELEEREMEIRCRLQVLEITLPALMIWFLWKMLNSVRPYVRSLPSENILTLREIGAPETPTGKIVEKDKNDSLKEKLRILEMNFEEESAKLLESRKAEEELRFRLAHIQEIVKVNHEKQTDNCVLFDNDINKDLILKCRELENKCYEMQEKINEYENMEKRHTLTIHEADEYWAKEKADLRETIHSLEEKLLNKDKELDRIGSQLKRFNSQEIEAQLIQEQINQTKKDMISLEEKLLRQEKDKRLKEETEKDLWQQLSEALEQIEHFKMEVEVGYKEEIRELKKNIKYLNEQLDSTSQTELEDRHSQSATIKNLRTSLRQKTKDLAENEVNISELKEEVITLENALIEHRKQLEQEQHEKELYQIQVGAELAAKDEEIKYLMNELTSVKTESLAESLITKADLKFGSPIPEDPNGQERQVFGTEHQVDMVSTMDVAASRSSPTKRHLPEDCLRTKALAEEGVPINVPDFINILQAALAESTGCQNCTDKGTTEKLKHTIETVQQEDSTKLRAA